MTVKLFSEITDVKLSEKLQLDTELTMEKALAHARQHEAVKAQQPVLRGHKSESVDTVKTKPQWSNKRDKKSVTKTTSQQQHNANGVAETITQGTIVLQETQFVTNAQSKVIGLESACQSPR